MGMMIDGRWSADTYLDLDDERVFERAASTIRDWVGTAPYPAEAGRYHLYVMEACPWAHRTWIYHRLKKLDGIVTISFVLPRPTDQGWAFDRSSDRYRDPLEDREALFEVYQAGADRYTGRVTVPVLFDKKTGRIVNNESADIVRMFNSAFDHLIEGETEDYYPEPLREEIDALNERIYAGLNNGVYRAGFTKHPQRHAAAVDEVFATLDFMERRLSERRFLAGDRVTEADWRAFPTLLRFDAAYYSAFRCNKRRLVDYPNVWRYAKSLHDHPRVKETVMPLETYRHGYHSIPFAVGHDDPIPTTPIPSFASLT